MSNKHFRRLGNSVLIYHANMWYSVKFLRHLNFAVFADLFQTAKIKLCETSGGANGCGQQDSSIC